MPTINEIMNGFGVPDSAAVEKTASAKSTEESSIEKQAKALGLIDDTEETGTTKTASNNEEKSMNLKDLYEQTFGAEKTASAEEEVVVTEEEKVASLEEAGEQAGAHFAERLGERLMVHAVKLAMDGSPESAATQERDGGAAAVSGHVGDPQLPVNRPADADKPIDTTPQRIEAMSEFDKATTKARVEAALASGNPGELSHKSHNVDTGLETPSTQKTASIKDFSEVEQVCYGMKFAPEMMKEARAYVAQEQEKVAELRQTADECYTYGAELAMKKIAEMEEKAQEKKEDDKEEEESDEEKTASAMGDFILEGYWNTLMEKGAEFYGDQDVYIEELLKEAGLDKVAAAAKKLTLLAKGQKMMNSAGKSAKKQFGNLKSKAKAGVTKGEAMVKKNPKASIGGAAALGLGAGALAAKD